MRAFHPPKLANRAGEYHARCAPFTFLDVTRSLPWEPPCQRRLAVAQSPRMRTVHAVFQKDGEWFIARCLDVPVTTQGRTLAAAKKNLCEAVELYFENWGGPKRTKTPQEVYLTSMEVAA